VRDHQFLDVYLLSALFLRGHLAASTSLRSNFPLLSAKNTQSEPLSQLVVAGMTTSRLAAAFGAPGFAARDACAKTTAGRANAIPNASTLLALIEPSLPLEACAEAITALNR
jgi:hypothetical protein